MGHSIVQQKLQYWLILIGRVFRVLCLQSFPDRQATLKLHNKLTDRRTGYTTVELHNKLTYLDDLFWVPHRGTECWLVVRAALVACLSIQLEQDSSQLLFCIQVDPKHHTAFHRGPGVATLLKWTKFQTL